MRSLLVREPGGTETGERIRQLLKDPALELDPLAELLLFCAARAELVAQVIGPAREAGRDVVCDRFSDSSIAYQGVARGLGAERVEEICDLATGGRLARPDDPAAHRSRARGGADRPAQGRPLRGGGDRAAAPGRRGLRRDRRRHPERVRVVDAEGDRDAVHAAVLAEVAAAGATRVIARPPPAARRSPRPLAEATRHQPRARAALVAALASPGPRLHLPRARAAPARPPRRGRSRPSCSPRAPPDPDDARRRALLDPSPHPDLVWLRPPGAQHLVEDVRESVIRAVQPEPGGGRAPRLRHRGGRGPARREPERAAEDARGAGALRPPDPDLLRAGAARRDDPLALRPGRVRAARARTRCSRRSGAGEEADAAARLSGGDVELARPAARTSAARRSAPTAEAAARAAALRSRDARALARAARRRRARPASEAGAEEERRLVEEAEATARSAAARGSSPARRPSR